MIPGEQRGGQGPLVCNRIYRLFRSDGAPKLSAAGGGGSETEEAGETSDASGSAEARRLSRMGLAEQAFLTRFTGRKVAGFTSEACKSSECPGILAKAGKRARTCRHKHSME